MLSCPRKIYERFKDTQKLIITQWPDQIFMREDQYAALEHDRDMKVLSDEVTKDKLGNKLPNRIWLTSDGKGATYNAMEIKVVPDEQS